MERVDEYTNISKKTIQDVRVFGVFAVGAFKFKIIFIVKSHPKYTQEVQAIYAL